MLVFHNRNIIAPHKKELYGGLLCWAVYLFLPYLLIAIPFFREGSLRTTFLFDLTVSVVIFMMVLVVFRDFLFRSRIPFLMIVMTCFFGFFGSHALESIWWLLLSGFQSLLPETPDNMNQDLINQYLYKYSGLTIVIVSLFAPVTEELLLRGTIFAPLCKKSPFLAYSVSMFVFAGLHVMNFIGTQHWSVLLFNLLQYLPGGFVLCWSYQRSRSIWTPIVLHGLLNLYSTIVILS